MTVKLVSKEKIAYVILDRPEARNAVTMEMWSELSRIWSEIRASREIWAVILTAEGDHFTVGTDLKELAMMLGGDPTEQARTTFWHSPPANPLPQNLWKPVVAAVKGYCLGVGFTLVAASDVVIAAENTVFSFPEVRVGLPTVAGSWWLSRKVPPNVASELLLTGRRLSAKEAFRYGLVNRLVAQSEVLATAEAIAGEICKNAPLAVWATKEIINRGMELPFEEASRLGESMRTVLFHSKDAKEGPLAFVEKREPRYAAE